uniref:Uncharacterized protein n=1 Tax=Chelonoidis abingdonii TaxID=106734 RepID=A0A8C0G2F1_CHEAB
YSRFLVCIFMPKTLKITPEDYVTEFGKDKFHIDGNVLFCTVHSETVDYVQRQTIVEYMESTKYKLKPSATVQKPCTVTGSFQSVTTAKEQRPSVTSDFVQMCIKADIPLHKMDLPEGGAIPKSDQLYSHYLTTSFEEGKTALSQKEQEYLWHIRD